LKTAGEIMEPATTVAPEQPVAQLAQLLLHEHLDGVCVIDEAGQLAGVVTSMDLIYQEKRLHLPTFFVLFDSVLPLENPKKAEEELHKIAGSTAAEVMTPKPVTVTQDTPLDRVASLMVERHLTVIPVTEDGELKGIVTKPAMIRAAFDLL